MIKAQFAARLSPPLADASGASSVGRARPGPASRASAGSSLLRLQRQYGNRYVQGVVERALASGGRTLDPDVSTRLGRVLGEDLSQVKVHTDLAADRLSQSLNADAFTAGDHIFFRANRYDPHGPEGRHLLAHELTHVVQQGSAVRPAGPWRVTQADDAHEREADRVAAGAISGGSEAATVQPVRSPSIQRKVYVGKEQLSPLRGGPEPSMGERAVVNMLADEPSRYFESEDELYAYAKGQTETIGYVRKEKAWVRIDPGKLLILGENHEQTTLPDVVEAVGTKRWMYEQFSDLPEWVPDAYIGVDPPAGGVWERLAAQREEGTGHEAENFLFKAGRGLAGFNPEGHGVYVAHSVTDTEWKLFRQAVYVASVAEWWMPGLYKAYLANQVTLEPVLSTESGNKEKWGNAVGWDNVRDGVRDLRDAFISYATESMEAQPSYKLFSQEWRTAKPSDYVNPGKVRADRFRDFSMYRHIRLAMKNHYLLYGLGNMHLSRLRHLLKSLSRRLPIWESGIIYMTMEEFIRKQKKMYPQE